MKYTEANLGRIFILRLENGDKIPDSIEFFAREKNIKSATVMFIGAGDKKSKVVTGPEDGSAKKIITVVKELANTSEAVGIGTIFTNEENKPILHLHASFGNKTEVITGCTREGVDIWHVGEVIILEMLNNSAVRKIDPDTGFELLKV